MDKIKLVSVRGEVFERISQHNLKRIFRLRLNVHTDHLEACAMVTGCGATSAAKEIEQSRPHAAPALSPASAASRRPMSPDTRSAGRHTQASCPAITRACSHSAWSSLTLPLAVLSSR